MARITRSAAILVVSISLILSVTLISAQEVSAVGLKVFVNLSHSKSESANVCVSSTSQNLGCKTIALSGVATPYVVGPFIFGDNMVTTGGQFKACATNLATKAFRCVTGTNGPAKLPEYVSVTLPGGIQNAANEDWLGTCKTIEWGLTHTCGTYVKPDGSLTFEGKRAKDCISNGGLLTAAGFIGGLPPNMIIAVLEPASKLPLYDCDGIVNWQILKGASDAVGFLKVLGIG